jgi:hypothetical protein
MNAAEDTLPWPSLDQVDHIEDIEVLRYLMLYLPPSADASQMAIIARLAERIRLLRPRGGPRIKLIPRNP